MKKINFYHYDSVFDMVAIGDNEGHKTYSSHTGSQRFCASNDYDHMKHILSNPKEALPDAHKIENIIIDNITSKSEATVYDVAGSFVDVGVFVTGEPEHMIEFAQVEDNKKYCTLIIEYSEPAATSAENMKRRAGVIAAMIDKLESENVRCQVFAMALMGQNNNHKIGECFLTKIKDHDQPMNILNLTFLHPSFWRRATFAAIEKDCLEKNPHYGYHGKDYYHIFKNEVHEELNLSADEKIIHLPKLYAEKDRSFKTALSNEDWNACGDYVTKKVKTITDEKEY